MAASVSAPVQVDFLWRRFRITLASNDAERRAAQALRYEVFCHEWQGRQADIGLDEDQFDDRADHLLLYDQQHDGLLVGTYRFIRGETIDDFYSSTEFQIDNLVAMSGTKVELGRACLRREWRSNLSLIGLFRGICEYVVATGCRFLFGCSSIDTTDPVDIVRLVTWFRRYHMQLDDDHIEPLLHCRIRTLDHTSLWRRTWTQTDEDRVQELMPPLLRSYLRAGAKVSQRPIIDPEFNCTDFLTVLDLQQANIGFIDRFRV
jgi:L-ornithine Nalpha-acyltransferase